jgi:hypothetical protein
MTMLVQAFNVARVMVSLWATHMRFFGPPACRWHESLWLNVVLVKQMQITFWGSLQPSFKQENL